jgi:hypothetical protein
MTDMIDNDSLLNAGWVKSQSDTLTTLQCGWDMTIHSRDWSRLKGEMNGFVRVEVLEVALIRFVYDH